MSTPIFLPEDEKTQVEALKEYLINKGCQSLSETTSSPQGWPYDLSAIFVALKECWVSNLPESECEDVLTTVGALILLIPPNIPDMIAKMVDEFCQMCESLPNEIVKKKLYVLESLNLVLLGLETGKTKLRVYQAILTCCQNFNFVAQPVTDNEKVNNWLMEWQCNEEDKQDIWRRLRDIHLQMERRDQAADAMIRLLTTYTNASAVHARTDAIQCIVSALMDPAVLVMDHILLLEPVKVLEGTPMHDLLAIFVSGNIQRYNDFIKQHAALISEHNLVEDQCRAKIRILAFMKMASKLKDVSYDDIKKQLDLQEDDVEEFVMEAARQKAVQCKMDQIKRTVTISGVMPVTFDKESWVNLRGCLQRWKSELEDWQQLTVN